MRARVPDTTNLTVSETSATSQHARRVPATYAGALSIATMWAGCCVYIRMDYYFCADSGKMLNFVVSQRLHRLWRYKYRLKKLKQRGTRHKIPKVR